MSVRIKENKIRYIIGIDEAGRGPLAGPVSLAALCVKVGDQKIFKGGPIKDSKQLTEKDRERVFEKLKQLKKSGKVSYACSLIGSEIIDRIGIVKAIRLGIKNVLDRLSINPKESQVFLDGGIKAPRAYKNQKTIIRGDETVAVIAHASIIAKVTRDRRMKKLAVKFPSYDFHIHKGYGTIEHYRRIKKHGFCIIHRLSFLRNVQSR